MTEKVGNVEVLVGGPESSDIGLGPFTNLNGQSNGTPTSPSSGSWHKAKLTLQVLLINFCDNVKFKIHTLYTNLSIYSYY